MVCVKEKEVKEVDVVGELQSSRICLFIHVQACNVLKNKKTCFNFQWFSQCVQ